MRRSVVNLLGRECKHERNVVVRSVGVQRTICQRCGHVAFTMIGHRQHLSSRPAELESVVGL